MQSFLSHIVTSPSREELGGTNSANSVPRSKGTAKAVTSIANANLISTAIISDNNTTNTIVTASMSIGSVWSGPSDSLCPNENSMASGNFRASSRNVARLLLKELSSTSTRPTTTDPIPFPVPTMKRESVQVPPTFPQPSHQAKDAFDTESEDDSPEPADCCFGSPPSAPYAPYGPPQPTVVAPPVPSVLQMTSFLQPLPTASLQPPAHRPNPSALLGSQLRHHHPLGESMMSVPPLGPRARYRCNQSQSRGEAFSNESRSPLMSLLSFTVSTDRRPTFAREVLAAVTAPYIKPSKLSQSRLDSQPLSLAQNYPYTSVVGQPVPGPSVAPPVHRDPIAPKLPQEPTNITAPPTQPQTVFVPPPQTSSHATAPLPKKRKESRILDCALPASPTVELLTTLVPYTWLEPPMQVVSQRRGKGLELTPSLAEEWTAAMKNGGLHTLPKQ